VCLWCVKHGACVRALRAMLRRPTTCVRACADSDSEMGVPPSSIRGDVTGLSVLTQLKYMCVCVVHHPTAI
jgi:hypothetical protein